MESAIAAALVKRGQQLFDAEPGPVEFSKHPDADALLNDLTNHPHAFVLACVMDRQIKAERAWAIPHLVAQELGGFSLEHLSGLSVEEIRRLFAKLSLHRFPDTMSQAFHAAIERIATTYGGNAARIWSGRPSSAEVVFRFLEFSGVGPKIATMATNILARDFKVPLADHYSIDISADVHVQRVFWRLGLVKEDAGPAEVIYRARSLCPSFPGLMDLPVWEIGREWCRPNARRCGNCYMSAMCPSALPQSEA